MRINFAYQYTARTGMHACRRGSSRGSARAHGRAAAAAAFRSLRLQKDAARDARLARSAFRMHTMMQVSIQSGALIHPLNPHRILPPIHTPRIEFLIERPRPSALRRRYGDCFVSVCVIGPGSPRAPDATGAFSPWKCRAHFISESLNDGSPLGGNVRTKTRFILD